MFAAIFAFAQNHLSLLPSGFNINATVLRGLASVNDETIAVALAAGVAGMLAFETRASSGVGVAISVTTIPAAAYLGVAAGLGQASQALGALAVLGTNVAMMVARRGDHPRPATPARQPPQRPTTTRLTDRQPRTICDTPADRSRSKRPLAPKRRWWAAG